MTTAVSQGLTDKQLRALMEERRTQQMERTEQYWFVKPQDYQKAFMLSTVLRILIHGGNRSGKTMLAIFRLLKILSGEDPYSKAMNWKPPIRLRVCGAGMHEQVLKVLVQWFRDLTPRDWLEDGEFRFNTQTGIIRFSERGPCRGGFVEFMSYDQDPEKGSGRPLHGVVFDEAYKCGARFRNQCLSRLMDFNGFAWSLETPEEGDATWSVKWYEKARNGDSKYAVFCFPTRKNRFISAEAIEQLIEDCEGDEIQQRIRLDGEFISIGGLIYPILDAKTHVKNAHEFRVDSSWTKYLNIDPGLRKDHALVWSAVGPGKRCYFYRELYIGGTMEEMMKAAIKHSNSERVAAVNFDPHWDWNNRTVKMKDGTTPFNLKSSLREAMDSAGYSDTPLIEARRDNSAWFGIDQVAAMLRPDELSGVPQIAFSPECQRLWDEMRRYKCVRPKDREPTRHRPQLFKVDDDGPDCVRIAVTSPMEWLGGHNRLAIDSHVVVDEWGCGF